MSAFSKFGAVAGYLCTIAAAMGTLSPARAAEINVIASTAMREVMEELDPMFERASGHKVTVSFLSGAVLPVKLKDGAQADLVVTTPETIDDLVKAGKVVAGTGLDFVAPLPKELQANIIYATATPTTAKEKAGAAALVKFMSSAPAVPVVKKLGLDPA